MAKSKTPLTIAITNAEMLGWPEVKKLEEQGHNVVLINTAAQLVLGDQCHIMDESLRKYLLLAVKETQERVKTKRKVTHGVDDQACEPEASPKAVEADEGGASEGPGEGEAA